jgi:lysozyme
MPILPSQRPVQTKDAILRLAKEKGVATGVFIVAIRGFFRDSMGKPGQNDLGIYDDALFLVGPDYFKSFNANTDPSVDRKGIACLIPGVYRYKKGRHGISHGAGYPALRPATEGEKLPVMRDGKGGFGVAINIHRGGFTSTSSEGCQTIYPDQWQEFISNVYRLMDENGLDTVRYVLTVKPDLP